MNFKRDKKNMSVKSLRQFRQIKANQIEASSQGFTLIEIILAVFIFSLVMIALAGIFSKSMLGYRVAKVTQRNLEDAQFVMNQIMKTLRTSSLDPTTSTPAEIKMYDYSSGKCYHYRFYNNKIQIAFSPSALPSDTPDPVGLCSSFSGTFNDMAAFYVQGRFNPVASNKNVGSERLGRATVLIELCQDATCSNDRIRIQSSVSLRDYFNAGI